ncbi:MAG: 2-oxoglutarate dehydrogenase, E2 component, dihydrolipoamide succinyltransferase [Candidatus Eiseniibacteriota bacterium]|jgi:2-oxoglutarate dehydrogenase E2 component (dihydrolipoamide succinyltransferase)
MDVVMPQMGESVAEGTITRWLKKVGDTVKRDEPLFEISTDKVDAEIPSPGDGQLVEILHDEGDTVEVNVVVARLGDAGEQPAAKQAEPEDATGDGDGAAARAPAPAQEKAPAAQTPAAPAAQAPAAPAAQTPAAPAPAAAADASADELRRRRSSPLVRRIAAEHGIDLAQVPGTGSSGRVTKQDIMTFMERGAAAAPAAPTGGASVVESIPGPAFESGEETHGETMSIMRQKIAEHMVMSRRTSAHVTTVFEVDFTAVDALRRRHKERFKADNGVNLSITTFIARAAVDALRAFPIVNARLDDSTIVYHRHVNLGIAVALDWGLLVPVIRHAEEKNLVGLARSIHDLATRARSKKLKPEEVQGGTFSITNPGIFGSLFGTPIINQPQVAILGVGTVVKRPMVISAEDGSDTIAIRTMGYLNLSFDHRLVDGAIADQYLAHVKRTLEAAQFPELGN